MRIAVASGKGGTGKSTVATNLAYILSEKYNDVCLIDCDVEEPNCHIFLKPEIKNSEEVFLSVPQIDESICVGCGQCVNICQFNALAIVKKKIIVFPELCHSCGGCWLICPVQAVNKDQRQVGIVEKGISEKLKFIHGKSKIGEPMSPPLIKKTKKAGQNHHIKILDCPPGTSCPVITAVDRVDFVIMVTEPTPFGLYDLKLAVDVMKKLDKDFGIVINRSSENDYLIEDYAASENIEILTKIADDRRIAECYSKGKLVVKELPEYIDAFNPLLKLVKRIKQ
ncbi:MAG: ATP-binding protein [Candidatus Gastranaerophilales bacterium]|nr:ATP-binding protein [Candidatus Gastranaerophilales bacterium]